MADREPREHSNGYGNIASTVAAIGSLLAWSKNTAQAAGSPFPPEVADVLAAIAANLADIDQNLLPEILAAINNIVAAGGGGGGSVLGFPPNAENILTTVIPIQVTAVSLQLPDISCLQGMRIVIKAHPLNKNLVFVGTNAAAAANMNQAYPLIPNEPIHYQVKNPKTIWISGTVGDSVVITTEQ